MLEVDLSGNKHRGKEPSYAQSLAGSAILVAILVIAFSGISPLSLIIGVPATFIFAELPTESSSENEWDFFPHE